MLILMRFFILAFFFLFLNPCNTVNAFGDDWYSTYTDAKPSSPRVPEPEPVEINLHRKTAIKSAMPGIITKLGYFKDNDFVRENGLLFIVEV